LDGFRTYGARIVMSTALQPKRAPLLPLDGTLQWIMQEIVRGVVNELRPLVAGSIERSSAQPLATGQQMADLLHVSRATLDRYVGKGYVPYVRLGPDGPRRFRVEDVLASFQSRRDAPATTPVASTMAAGSDGVSLLRRRNRQT
jgi:hypothetical protein